MTILLSKPDNFTFYHFLASWLISIVNFAQISCPCPLCIARTADFVTRRWFPDSLETESVNIMQLSMRWKPVCLAQLYQLRYCLVWRATGNSALFDINKQWRQMELHAIAMLLKVNQPRKVMSQILRVKCKWLPEKEQRIRLDEGKLIWKWLHLYCYYMTLECLATRNVSNWFAIWTMWIKFRCCKTGQRANPFIFKV